ncbi:MAG: hypothetical protein KA522_00645 [Candidatus Saccharicenans sp.]|jgi:hypothetical protein|nr:hypothetical protein [Candidatus Saccharicenans sp.]
MLKTYLIVTISLFLLYVIKRPLIDLIKFICDSLIGDIIFKIGEWIEPSISSIKAIKSDLIKRLSSAKIVGSLFLFAVTILLCILNYFLIFYGMELLLPNEKGVGFMGMSPAALASVILMLAEVTLGFLFFESLGMTTLLKLHKTTKRLRNVLLGGFIFLFILLVAVEIGIAMQRIYEFGDSAMATSSKLESLMRGLPYGVTGLMTFVIPLLNAVSAYSLGDILPLAGALICTIFIMLLSLLNIIHKRLHYLITHIDDMLEKTIYVLTWPVELIVNGILYLLAKVGWLKKTIPVFLLVLSSLFLGISCSKTQTPQEESPELVAILIDNSGSFDSYLEKSLEHSIKYLDSLKGGDVIAIFPIDAESLSRKEPPIYFAVPVPNTTFGSREYRRQVKEMKEEVIKKISDIKLKRRSSYTDIAGAISRVSGFLSSERFLNYNRYLLIYSDMQDTKGRDLLKGTQLKGVSVKILYTDLTEKTQKGIDDWKKKLLELGAKEVKIYTPDECETQTDFSLKRPVEE